MREEVAREITSLASWAASTPLEAIPRDAQAKAVRILADDLGAIVGARDEPEVAAFHQKILGERKKEEATIFRGGRKRTDRLSAAVANATAADWLELDEGYRLTPCHAGLYVIPALMAEAEARNLSFAELLRALVLGYEIVTRVARAFPQKAATMQSHGRFSAVGAAAGVALSRGTHLLESISSAVTLTGPSPRNHLAAGILSRNIWPAAGAWSGTMAVEWAECGIAGDPGAFFDVYATVLGGTPQPGRLTADLGASWAVHDGYTKIYACCQHLHAAVEAALDLRKKIPDLDRIRSIVVETHELAMPLVNPSPRTTLAAKFSMSHAMGAALAMGSGGAEAFAFDTLENGAIAKLRERVSVAPWKNVPPPPNDRPARVIVDLGGEKLQAECLSAAGGPDRPLPPETVLEKMRSLASPAYPAMEGVFNELLALDPRRMKRGWSELVTEICS